MRGAEHRHVHISGVELTRLGVAEDLARTPRILPLENYGTSKFV
jgi:hypothetical protein